MKRRSAILNYGCDITYLQHYNSFHVRVIYFKSHETGTAGGKKHQCKLLRLYHTTDSRLLNGKEETIVDRKDTDEIHTQPFPCSRFFAFLAEPFVHVTVDDVFGARLVLEKLLYLDFRVDQTVLDHFAPLQVALHDTKRRY